MAKLFFYTLTGVFIMLAFMAIYVGAEMIISGTGTTVGNGITTVVFGITVAAFLAPLPHLLMKEKEKMA